MPKLMSTEQAARYLNVHRTTLGRYVRQGFVKRHKPNFRDNGYRLEELADFQNKLDDGEFNKPISCGIADRGLNINN